MGSRRPQTMAKRAREQALRERRERKQAKKDARRSAGSQAGPETPEGTVPQTEEPVVTTTDGQPEQAHASRG